MTFPDVLENPVWSLGCRLPAQKLALSAEAEAHIYEAGRPRSSLLLPFLIILSKGHQDWVSLHFPRN